MELSRPYEEENCLLPQQAKEEEEEDSEVGEEEGRRTRKLNLSGAPAAVWCAGLYRAAYIQKYVCVCIYTYTCAGILRLDLQACHPGVSFVFLSGKRERGLFEGEEKKRKGKREGDAGQKKSVLVGEANPPAPTER